MLGVLRRLDGSWARRHVRKADVVSETVRKPVCIVTGGSEGIGKALAAEFAKEGHRLLLIARSAETLEQAAADLRRDHAAEVIVAAVDLTRPGYLERIEQTLDQHGLYTDILINNAGFGIGGPFASQEFERLEALCRLNVEALTVLTRAFLPDMLRRARGGVLNVASLGGMVPGPFQAAYYASKAYVISLTEALAHENAGRGVRISAVAPGPVATRFHERMGAERAHLLSMQHVMPPETVARVAYRGFAARRTVIVPGAMATFNAAALRFMPRTIMVPFIGWFLKQRY